MTLKGYRECWCTSSLQPHLALASYIDIGQSVHWKPPSGIDHGNRKWSPCPDFLPPTQSVTKFAIVLASPLIFQPLLVMNSTPAFPTLQGMLCGQKASLK